MTIFYIESLNVSLEAKSIEIRHRSCKRHPLESDPLCEHLLEHYKICKGAHDETLMLSCGSRSGCCEHREKANAAQQKEGSRSERRSRWGWRTQYFRSGRRKWSQPKNETSFSNDLSVSPLAETSVIPWTVPSWRSTLQQNDGWFAPFKKSVQNE